MKKASLCAMGGLFVLSIAAPSYAKSVTLEVVLAKPLDRKSDFALENVVWQCEGDRCVSRSMAARIDSLALCKSLAKRYGDVLKFTVNTQAIPAEQLSRCNIYARK